MKVEGVFSRSRNVLFTLARFQYIEFILKCTWYITYLENKFESTVKLILTRSIESWEFSKGLVMFCLFSRDFSISDIF